MTMIVNNPNAVDDVFIYAIDILEALHDKFRRRNIPIALPDITSDVVTRIEMISKNNNVVFTGALHLSQRTENIRGRDNNSILHNPLQKP